MAQISAGSNEFPVILHSSNDPARTGMAELLHQHDWKYSEAVPYDDVAWIAETWFPSVKRALRGVSKKPRASSVKSPTELRQPS